MPLWEIPGKVREFDKVWRVATPKKWVGKGREGKGKEEMMSGKISECGL